MIKGKLRSFDVDHGDCCIIRLIDDERMEEYSIMTDCCVYTKAVEDYIHSQLNGHLDLLIITHIDNDHISGIKQMLEKGNVTIGKILYNSYRRKPETDTKQLTERQAGFLKQLVSMFPKEFDAQGYRLIGAEEAGLLCDIILKNAEYRQAWNLEFITRDTQPLALKKNDIDFGRLIFLAPGADSLAKVDKEIRATFHDIVMDPLDNNLENLEQVFEIISILNAINNEENEVEQVSFEKIKKDADYYREKGEGKYRADSEYKNKASIGYMLESEGHKIAMLGDSPAKEILEGLNKWYEGIERPINCDAIKISHHGSERSTNTKLLKNIQSSLYFIAGGAKNGKATDEVVGMITNSNQSENPATIIFSRPTEATQELADLSDEIKDELKLEIKIDSKEHDIF